MRSFWLVYHHNSLLLMVFTEIGCLKNIFTHLVTLSTPKVAKNGWKVPISVCFEFEGVNWTFAQLWSLCDVMWWILIYFFSFWTFFVQKRSKITKISENRRILEGIFGYLGTFTVVYHKRFHFVKRIQFENIPQMI